MKIIQNAKTTRIVNHACLCLSICKQNIVCVIQHLKNNVCLINQCPCHLGVNFNGSYIFF